MSDQHLFLKLEDKINQILELTALLRLQVEESEDKNAALQSDNVVLKQRQSQWEQSLTALLQRLEGADLSGGSLEHAREEYFEEELEDALA